MKCACDFTLGCASATAIASRAISKIGRSASVVAHARDRLRAERQNVQQLAQRRQLVLHALADPGHAELAHAPLDRARLPAGDHRDLQSGAQHLHDARAVAHVKTFQLLAARREIQPAVGQHAVHVEHQQADVVGALDQGIHHITPARNRS